MAFFKHSPSLLYFCLGHFTDGHVELQMPINEAGIRNRPAQRDPSKKRDSIDARASSPGLLIAPFQGYCPKILIDLKTTAFGHCLSLRAAYDDVIQQTHVHERQGLLEPGGYGAVGRRWVRRS